MLTGLDATPISAAGGKPAEAVALLALVAGQDVEPAEGSDGTDGRWRIARQVAPDRVISTVDPETRHAHKTRERRQDGFKAHVVVEPDTGLITAARLTKATGPDNSDATVGAGLLDADTTLPARRSRSAAGGAAAEDRGAGARCWATRPTAPARCSPRSTRPDTTAVIKPWPTRPAVEGGFTIDDFAYDDQAGTVTCPNGLTRRSRPKRSGHLRRGLPRLPAAGPVHHLRPRPQDHRPPPREAAARPPARAPRSRLPADLPAAPAAWSNAPSPG